MKPGSILDIQLLDVHCNPLAMPDISVDIILYSGVKERYQFDAGITDAQGCVSTSHDMLERTRKENRAFAVMDYNTKLEDCEDTVGLTVPTLDKLRERLAAVSKWFPENEPRLSERVKSSKNGNVTASSRMEAG